ncbi:MAG: heavy-metal-associated domain-containing protein [Candidatus Binatia bacterium]
MKAAVSRLEFAPAQSDMKVDLDAATLEFTARPGTRIDREKLEKAIEDAGYRVEDMEITPEGGGGSK